MEQKDYKMEIVKVLSKEEKHARGIAKELDINHMMINRKLRELRERNVVDFRLVGKNKIYFLKESVEERVFRLMSEEYTLLRLIETYPRLRGIVDKIRRDKRIKLAILFGSYVKRNVSKSSDIDIFVESTNRRIKDDLKKIDSRISVKLGKYDRANNLIKEIDKNHVIIKGFEEYYEK